MNINKKFLPLKAHFFFFLGSVSPVIPFLMVVARQLGIPVIFFGTIGSCTLLLTVLLKPIVGSAADAFPKLRKAIFISLLAIMAASFASIDLLPKLHGSSIELSLFTFNNSYIEDSNANVTTLKYLYSDNSHQLECFAKEAWDCKLVCLNDSDCQTGTISSLIYNQNLSLDSDYRIYDVQKYSFQSTETILNFSCVGGIFDSPACPSLLSFSTVWIFSILYILGNVGFTIANSITDAISIDLVGKDGDYGNERAWGTVGWGIMGPISGFIIDWLSGTNLEKDYTPAFAILFIYGLIDIMISLKLKVPRFKAESGVWTTVLPLLKKPQIIVFFLFAIFNGAFDGIAGFYVFVLQEDMAKGTSYKPYMTFIQGLTIFLQCFFEAPFMWVYSWFEKKLGARRVTSLVFFLFIFRLFGLAFVGSYGPVWATMITETLNGPCFGLGYTALVVYAGQIAPYGTSATFQSLANIYYESFGYALAFIIGGILYAHIGGPGLYYVFGGMATITFVLHFISLFVFKEEMYIKPEENELSSLNSPAQIGEKETELKEGEPLQSLENADPVLKN